MDSVFDYSALWMNEWTNERTNEWMNERVSEWMDQWMKDFIIVSVVFSLIKKN